MKTRGQIHIRQLPYPINPELQGRIIGLLQKEWRRTDVDWLDSMQGHHADTLHTCAALAEAEGEAVGTASVAYPVQDPEVCIIEDVMTAPEYRGRGIGTQLTNTLVERAFQAGCRVAYLGNAPHPSGSLYEKCGFQRIRGALMRRAAPGRDDCESGFFARGQPATVRETVWGDLPGVACLMAQPMEPVLADYRHGLVSIRHCDPIRCVSNFTSIWYDVARHAGTMFSLIGEAAHRVLGFGYLIPGPAPLRNRTAVVDVTVHDHFADQVPQILQRLQSEAQRRRIRALWAAVAALDTTKARWFLDAGFQQAAVLSDQVWLEGHPLDVLSYCWKLPE